MCSSIKLKGIFNSNSMKKILTLLTIVFLFSVHANAQIFINPIAGKQSHPELEIIKINITDKETIIFLKVTNKLNQGGWFCANENIYIKNSKGTEIYKLIKSDNIPTCPNQFEFSYSEQTLEFTLYFPPISKEITFLDLIESCNNACFSFNGIILDNEHNEKIRAFEKGFDLYKQKQNQAAIPYFEKVVSNKVTLDSHIYGLSYYYLIIINNESGNREKVDFWYQNLANSELEDKNTFIKELEKSGIKK